MNKKSWICLQVFIGTVLYERQIELSFQALLFSQTHNLLFSPTSHSYYHHMDPQHFLVECQDLLKLSNEYEALEVSLLLHN